MMKVLLTIWVIAVSVFMYATARICVYFGRVTKHHHSMIEMNTEYIVKQIRKEIGEEEFERISDLAFQQFHGDASIQVDDAINRILGRKGKNGLG